MTMDRYSGTGISSDPEVEALADVWATVDGHKAEFLAEKSIAKGGFARDDAIIREGYYQGYKAEAEEVINRLNRMGFDVKPIRKAELKVVT